MLLALPFEEKLLKLLADGLFGIRPPSPPEIEPVVATWERKEGVGDRARRRSGDRGLGGGGGKVAEVGVASADPSSPSADMPGV